MKRFREGYISRTDPLYGVWTQMKQRCYNSTNTRYKNYGARGVQVCQRWHNFISFRDDMFPTYSPGLTIDRIDSNGNYEPENCRWATYKEQANNKTTNRIFTINGETRNLTQWADFYGIGRSKVRTRFYVYKWPIERVLNLVDK